MARADSNSAALITGSAGGIGQALVKAFSDAGYFVVGVDRGHTPGADHSLKKDLSRLADEHRATESFRAALDSALDGRQVHTLVNNAAAQSLGPVEKLSIETFRSLLDVNLVAAFALIKWTLPYLEQSRGAVINIGSIHARLTKPGFSAYAASKGGLEALTRALAVEFGERLRVNAISPAAVETPMLRAGFEGESDAFEALAKCHPAGRIALPGEVAEVAVFLAGDFAGFMNGSVLDVSGGIGSRLHDPV